MNNWTFIAEQRPTKDDADINGMVLIRDRYGVVAVTRYSWVTSSSIAVKWARIPREGEGE